MPLYRTFTQKFVIIAVSAVALQVPASNAWSQSSCSSDGQHTPTALIERFISADCEACWTNPAAAKTKPHELALDWIVPSFRGDEAALSAAANRDALHRLQTLNLPATKESFNLRRAVLLNPLPLRVARGVALGGYMGASIALTPRPGSPLTNAPMTAWLVMIEDIPAGTDGTKVARQLVRNSLEIRWNVAGTKLAPTITAPWQQFYESRPMSIPAGANPDRLRVVGWVEDLKGKVITSAASVCVE